MQDSMTHIAPGLPGAARSALATLRATSGKHSVTLTLHVTRLERDHAGEPRVVRGVSPGKPGAK